MNVWFYKITLVEIKSTHTILFWFFNQVSLCSRSWIGTQKRFTCFCDLMQMLLWKLLLVVSVYWTELIAIQTIYRKAWQFAKRNLFRVFWGRVCQTPRLASNLCRSSSLILPNVGIVGMRHYGWLKCSMYVSDLFLKCLFLLP